MLQQRLFSADFLSKERLLDTADLSCCITQKSQSATISRCPVAGFIKKMQYDNITWKSEADSKLLLWICCNWTIVLVCEVK